MFIFLNTYIFNSLYIDKSQHVDSDSTQYVVNRNIYENEMTIYCCSIFKNILPFLLKFLLQYRLSKNGAIRHLTQLFLSHLLKEGHQPCAIQCSF